MSQYRPDFFTYESDGIFEVRVASGLELDIHKGPAFGNTLREAIAERACSAIVVDVNGAAYVDSTALSHLIEARSAAQEKGIAFVLDSGANKRIQKLLQITGLVDIFQIITEYPEG